MTDSNTQREVNADEEVLNLEDDQDDETDDDGDEDVITKDQVPKDGEDADGAENSADDSEEEETKEAASADDSSPEGDDTKGDEKPEELAPSQKTPAPVVGETDREKALRLELTRVKGKLREKNVSDLVDDTSASTGPAADAITKLKEMGYSDEEIKNMDTAIDLIASSKGYVKQGQNYQQAVNEEVNGFIKANPEYKPENDPEDVRWEAFQRILKSDYNINGKTREQLSVIFRKVKKDVDEELGAPAAQAKAETDATEARKTAAQKQKIKSVSHSGGTKSPDSKTKNALAPEVRSHFKGFDDEDLE